MDTIRDVVLKEAVFRRPNLLRALKNYYADECLFKKHNLCKRCGILNDLIYVLRKQRKEKGIYQRGHIYITKTDARCFKYPKKIKVVDSLYRVTKRTTTFPDYLERHFSYNADCDSYLDINHLSKIDIILMIAVVPRDLYESSYPFGIFVPDTTSISTFLEWHKKLCIKEDVASDLKTKSSSSAVKVLFDTVSLQLAAEFGRRKLRE